MTIEIDNLPLVFIRHKMWSSPEVYQELFNNHLIALHYKNIESTDPEDYEGEARNVMKRLLKYCETGALVAADYSRYPPRKMLAGKILPNSKITARRFKPCEHLPEGCFYKIVKLEDVVEFDYAEHRLLEGLQPRRGGIIVRWSKGRIEPYLKALYKKRLYGDSVKISPSVYLLTDSQLEVLCSEFLRTDLASQKVRIDYLLTPVGRTMKGTDIDGARKEKLEDVNVLAQVSFSTNREKITEKIEKLRGYAKKCGGSKKLVLVYFGPSEAKLTKIQLKNIEYISIEEVFAKMYESRIGIVEDMLP